MPARPSAPPPARRSLVMLILSSMAIAAIAGGLTLWTSRELRAIKVETEAIRKQAEGCAAPVQSGHHVKDPQAPPQDRVQRDVPYLGSEGVDISALMRVRVARVDARKRLQEVRFGAHSVLPARAVHVLNLWAVWCVACKDEMPDLQGIFDRRAADWGTSVDFVAMQVNDHSDPIDAYEQWAPMMPGGTIKLADRGMGAPVLEVLKGDDQRQPLYYGDMPVTLVLDCNRRVRWAKFERLSEADLRDLEAKIDDFRAELADDGPGGRCSRVWCGNGRCEAGEAGACVEDCGERSASAAAASEEGVSTTGMIDESPERASAGDPSPPLPRESAVKCPSHCARCTADGRCIAKLQGGGSDGASEPAKPAVNCGDGVCESSRGESTENCCQDCGCRVPLECVENDGGHICRPRLKM